MADGHRRRFDSVVVWKFDRFARSVSHLLRALETFKALGIEFVSLSEQVDTSTPTGKMVFTVLGAVAELERSLIAERVRAGLRNARAKGKRLGRPRRILDPKKITALRASGASWRAISAQLGVGIGTLDPDLVLDLQSHEVTKGGKPVQLTRLEFRILYMLALNEGRIIPYSRLIEYAWGYYDEGNSNLLKTHICHIRKKLGLAPTGKRGIKAVLGVGYSLSRG